MGEAVINAGRSAHQTSVLIAGAGPTGLALACDLRGRGIDVTIIDKATGPATTSRALGLQPRGTEILERLGALGDLPQRAVNALALNFHSGDRSLFRIEMRAMPGIAVRGPLLIGQSEVEGQLRARLAELAREVAWGTELVAAEEGRATSRSPCEAKPENTSSRWIGSSAVMALTAKRAGWPASPSTGRPLPRNSCWRT